MNKKIIISALSSMAIIGCIWAQRTDSVTVQGHPRSIARAPVANPDGPGFVVEWDKIQFWVGDGPNKAALLVQFNDGKTEECYVWGYRWDPASLEASGEDMFRTVASECDDLLLFTQYTGWMGNTVCGIGYSKDNSLIGKIGFDFEGASADVDDVISFEYFEPNTFMGQTSAPGNDTPVLCDLAIAEAHTTHIIDHPLNQKEFGYPAYDYDWWQPIESLYTEERWHAGWYKGYWSYWVGGASSESLSYSGLGMTSRKLTNECVDAWCYNYLDGEYIDGVTGATSPSHTLNYEHFNEKPTAIAGLDSAPKTIAVYRLDGTYLGSTTSSLTPGIYIMKRGNKINKVIIK